MLSFKASAQYGDWKGTCAADNSNHDTISNFLYKKGLISDNEFLVGVNLFIGENHNGEVESPIISCLVIYASDYEAASAVLRSVPDPLDLRRVDIELTIDQFLGFFKRFSFAISPPGIDMTGREYTTTVPTQRGWKNQ